MDALLADLDTLERGTNFGQPIGRADPSSLVARSITSASMERAALGG